VSEGKAAIPHIARTDRSARLLDELADFVIDRGF
jgi:hypothetical protein